MTAPFDKKTREIRGFFIADGGVLHVFDFPHQAQRQQG
jgi:hypothetical protein